MGGRRRRGGASKALVVLAGTACALWSWDRDPKAAPSGAEAAEPAMFRIAVDLLRLHVPGRARIEMPDACAAGLDPWARHRLRCRIEERDRE